MNTQMLSPRNILLACGWLSLGGLAGSATLAGLVMNDALLLLAAGSVSFLLWLLCSTLFGILAMRRISRMQQHPEVPAPSNRAATARSAAPYVAAVRTPLPPQPRISPPPRPVEPPANQVVPLAPPLRPSTRPAPTRVPRPSQPIRRELPEAPRRIEPQTAPGGPTGPNAPNNYREGRSGKSLPPFEPDLPDTDDPDALYDAWGQAIEDYRESTGVIVKVHGYDVVSAVEDAEDRAISARAERRARTRAQMQELQEDREAIIETGRGRKPRRGERSSTGALRVPHSRTRAGRRY